MRNARRKIVGRVPSQVEVLHLRVPKAYREALLAAANDAGMSLTQWATAAIVAGLQSPAEVTRFKQPTRRERTALKQEEANQRQASRIVARQHRIQQALDLLAAGVTPGEIAVRLGVDASTVSRWMTKAGVSEGTRGITPRVQIALGLVASGISPRDAAERCGTTVGALRYHLKRKN